MTDRDVGLMGEKEFELWCAQVGLIANRAEVDRGSWDYLVQFPLPKGSAEVLSLDRLPSPITCWVQVKARESADAVPAVKLSNWLRMIDPAWPSFLLLLTFDHQPRPVAAHLVHVGEVAISRVLRRLRELGTDRVGDLNAMTMVASCRADDALTGLDGSAFRDALERHVGTNPSAYHEGKKRWFSAAGYEGPRFRFGLRTQAEPGQHVEDRLVDFALGLTDELPATLTHFDELRFGIPVPAFVERPLPTDVRISIPRLPTTPALVELKDIKGTRRAEFQCEFYNPRSVFPFLSVKRLRFRLVAPFFELLLATAAGDANITLHLPPLEQPHPLDMFAPAFQVFEWLRQGAKELTLTIRLPHASAATTLRSGQLFDVSRVEQDIVRSGLDAASLVHELHLDPKMPVSTGELLAARLHLADAATIVSADRASIQIGGDVTDDAPADLRVGYPMVTGAPIGRTLVLVGLAYHGVPVFEPPSGGRKRFKVTAPEREIVFVETIPMVPGVTYGAKEYVQRLSNWFEERGIGVLPPTEAEAGHTLRGPTGPHAA